MCTHFIDTPIAFFFNQRNGSSFDVPPINQRLPTPLPRSTKQHQSNKWMRSGQVRFVFFLTVGRSETSQEKTQTTKSKNKNIHTSI
jgi:hypothetical protein